MYIEDLRHRTLPKEQTQAVLLESLRSNDTFHYCLDHKGQAKNKMYMEVFFKPVNVIQVLANAIHVIPSIHIPQAPKVQIV